MAQEDRHAPQMQGTAFKLGTLEAIRDKQTCEANVYILSSKKAVA